MKKEYPNFNSFLNGYYYQTGWDDFENDSAIWLTYISNSDRIQITLLLEEVTALGKESNEYIFDYLNMVLPFGGLSFDTKEEARDFISKLRVFLTNITK